jgi:hypothetical protein
VSSYDEVTVDDPRSLDIDHMVPLAEAWVGLRRLGLVGEEARGLRQRPWLRTLPGGRHRPVEPSEERPGSGGLEGAGRFAGSSAYRPTTPRTAG